MMQIESKKTTELTYIEKKQICDCFEQVFKKHKSLTDFDNQFLNTCVGYSLHTMLKNDLDEVVGLYAVIPFEYIYKRKKLLFCIGVDFMIRKEYRNDFKNVLGLCNKSMQFAKENGISCIFAFPNDLSYQINTRILRMKEIGKLNTYILPYRIGDAKKSLKIFNGLSKLSTLMLLGISKLDYRRIVYNPMIHRDRDSFDSTRYKWFDADDYHIYKDDEMICSWKLSNFENIRAAFLLDVFPMSPQNFNKAINKMFVAEKEHVGLFIYVGCLPFIPTSIIKIPLTLAPKRFHFMAQILEKNLLDSREVFCINNWDVNLSSYDLL